MISVPDIPRLYTALAEWGACVLALLLANPRNNRTETVGISLAFLAAQCLLMVPTGGLPGLLWILCMIAAVVLMLLNIWVCCRLPFIAAAFHCIRAFLLAEFAASLEWQLYYFVCYSLSLELHQNPVFEYCFLALIYLAIGFTMYRMEHRYSVYRNPASTTDLSVALIIGVGVFALSNVSFLSANTPFSGQNGSDIYYIRTLVDLVGVAALYAYHVQCIESDMRYELAATTTLLENQYQQYCISKESIDLVNRKYHDLKHQITALREEHDPERRSEWLDEMEKDIRLYEAQNKTGNHILDTLLTGKSLLCQEHDITLTCVADGSSLRFMKTMDICAIFGNALDNAIEGTMQVSDPEQRLIHMTVSTQKGFLLINLENYFGGTLDFEDGLPQTTKKDHAYHGFGVKSIRSTVENYNGSVSMSTSSGWFELKILIPLPE